jgi:glycosyltransferase involved in cell wall biosynthesis
MKFISVVIPTLNRHTLLNKLVSHLLLFQDIDEIIIIDSSDATNPEVFDSQNKRMSYVRTQIKSAAIQRNIGLELVSKKTTHIAFIDDDTWPEKDYFSELEKTMNKFNAVGVSGITNDLYTKLKKEDGNGKRDIFKKLFFLASSQECVVLRSGVNTPVNELKNTEVQAQWLIGCSLWSRELIRNVRFDSSLLTNSIGEDVIFSIQASANGPLYVNKDVVLQHNSSTEYAKSLSIFEQWITNRKKIINLLGNSFIHKLCYIIANTGAFLWFALRNVKKPRNLIGSIKVYVASWKIFLQ